MPYPRFVNVLVPFLKINVEHPVAKREIRPSRPRSKRIREMTDSPGQMRVNKMMDFRTTPKDLTFTVCVCKVFGHRHWLECPALVNVKLFATSTKIPMAV